MTTLALKHSDAGRLLKNTQGRLVNDCPPPTCCACGDCCFSDRSTAHVTWSLQNLFGNCGCPPVTTYDVQLPFASCNATAVTWQNDPAACDFLDTWTCDGDTLGLAATVQYVCATGRWSLRIDAVRIDAEDPCAVTLFTHAAESGAWPGGNCCGYTSPTHTLNTLMVSPVCGDTATWSFNITIENNTCCRDEENNCQPHGEPDCTGACEEEGI